MNDQDETNEHPLAAVLRKKLKATRRKVEQDRTAKRSRKAQNRTKSKAARAARKANR